MTNKPSDMELREDLLFALTGDSYGEELYVDNKAKFLVEDLEPIIKKRINDAIQKERDELLALLPYEDNRLFLSGHAKSYAEGLNTAINQVKATIEGRNK